MQSAAAVLGFDEALTIVLQHAADLPRPPGESLALLACGDRVLAEPVLADRDQPPFNRSTRDGFAVRASDTLGPLKVVGQVRAGEQWQGSPLEQHTAIEIMTGAPIPAGADAVVMIEHVERANNSIRLLTGRDHSKRRKYRSPGKRGPGWPGCIGLWNSNRGCGDSSRLLVRIHRAKNISQAKSSDRRNRRRTC